MDEKPKQIVVNINDWLENRRDGYPEVMEVQLPATASKEEADKIRETQRHLQQLWESRKAEALLEGKLERTPRVCIECDEYHRYYLNDYMCFKCRDERE